MEERVNMTFKRTIGFTAILMLTAVNAFAQLAQGISFSAWGRGAFAPLVIKAEQIQSDGTKVDDYFDNLYVGTASARAGAIEGFQQEFSLKGDYDYIGFELGLGFDGEAGGGATTTKYWYNELGASIWVKPLGNELLKITGGTINDQTLRGKIGEVNNGWEGFVLSGAGYKDEIFTSFGKYNSTMNLGFMVSSVPVENLFIGLKVNAPGIDESVIQRADNMYRDLQIGVGYEIPGIGLARVQYIGGNMGKGRIKRLEKYIKDSGMDYISGTGDPFTGIPRQITPNTWHGDYAHVEAAFALTAVEGLLMDIGGKIYFPVTTGGTINFPSGPYTLNYRKSSAGFTVSGGAYYDIADLNLAARIDTTFGAYNRSAENDKSLYQNTGDGKFRLDVRLVPSYNLGFMKAGLDFGFKTEGNEIDADGKPIDPPRGKSRWGIGAFVRRDFAKGYIKGGVTYTSPTIWGDKNDKTQDPENMIKIPIVLEYYF